MKEQIKNKLKEQARDFVDSQEDYVFAKKEGCSHYSCETGTTCVTELGSLEETELTYQGKLELFEDCKEFSVGLINKDVVYQYFNLTEEESDYIDENDLNDFLSNYINEIIEDLEYDD